MNMEIKVIRFMTCVCRGIFRHDAQYSHALIIHLHLLSQQSVTVKPGNMNKAGRNPKWGSSPSQGRRPRGNSETLIHVTLGGNRNTGKTQQK